MSQNGAWREGEGEEQANASQVELMGEEKEERITLKVDPNDEIQASRGEEGGHFEFHNVNVILHLSKRGKKEEKQILFNVSGRLRRGQLLGILGGSGAGKSTFLNAISGRLITQGNKTVTGNVAWRGQRFELGKTDHVKLISAYVMQSDILSATQSSKEALQFSAYLRLPRNMTVAAKKERVQKIITQLKLEKAQDTLIGNDAIRGVSGGEKKRVSCGVELVTDPDLIFLDEPTSGLDSFTAMQTLKILKGLTEQGKQVIATIHQPSSEIFQLLDMLCLLAHGHVVYYGPAMQVIEYFDSLGYKCPQYSNPADFVVNTIQQDSDTFIRAWEQYVADGRCEFVNALKHMSEYPKLEPKEAMSAGFGTQLALILQREMHIFLRDPRPSRIRFAQTVVFALLVGLLYWNLPPNQQGLRDRFGAVFFLTVNSSMTGIISTILTFPEQRLLFERERNNSMYMTTTYLMAKTLVQVPEQMVFSLLYQLIVYWMVGMNSPFWQLYVTLTLGMASSGSVGLIVGSFAKNVGEAMQVMPLTFIPFLLFSNFLVSLDQIPVWIRWLEWIDPFKFVVDAMAITEFKGESFNLTTLPDGSKEGFNSGDSYLDYLGSKPKDLHFDWLMLVVLFVGFRLITWVILTKRNGF